MRRLVILWCAAGCTPSPSFEIVASERGPAMVKVPAAVVRLGRKLTPPVAGFVWAGAGPVPPANGPVGPPAPNGGIPGGAPIQPGPRPGAPDLGRAPGSTPSVGRPAPDPLEARDVDVSAFWIDRTEVTQGQYALFLVDTGYRPPFVDEPWAQDGWEWDGPETPAVTADHPVVLVSWWDAREYCEWAAKRLPTEAEWQLAAIGPADTERSFPWGDEYDGDKLNHGTIEPPNYDDSDGYARTSPVGSFPAGVSPYGLLDAFGNAWEWTADVRVASWSDMAGEREGQRLRDPHTGILGLYAAVRGGAYFYDLRPNPAGERSAFLPELRRKTSGFRCAKDG